MRFWYSKLKLFTPIAAPFFPRVSTRKHMETEIRMTQKRRVTRSAKVTKESFVEQSGSKRQRRLKVQVSAQLHSKDGELVYSGNLSPAHCREQKKTVHAQRKSPLRNPREPGRAKTRTLNSFFLASIAHGK